MIDFFAGCAGLFTSTFNAANNQGFFLFLSVVIMFRVCLGVFSGLSHGLQKM